MLSLTTFASGSGGNCLLVSAGNIHILIDAGISCRRITRNLKALGLLPEDLSAVLITHEHSDHVAGLATLVKNYPVPVYAGEQTAAALLNTIPGLERQICPFRTDGEFEAAGVDVFAFSTPHDTPGSVGYRLETGGRTVGVVTDLGYMPDSVLDRVAGADFLLLEANHDVETLKRGPYPYYLKRRILGDRGHLSNEASASAARAAAERGTRTIILAHLSQQNNTEELALAAVSGELLRAGFAAGEDVELSVAPRSEMGRPYILK